MIAWRLSSSFYLEALLNYFRTKLEVLLNCMLNARYGEIGVGLARGTDSNGLACWYCVQVFLVDGCEVTWVDGPAIG